MSTATRYTRIRQQLDRACRDAGRDPKEVTLLAVSKTVDLDQVELAISAGAHAFGENRPEELVRKQAAFPEEEWHFIGNIQSRRIKDIVPAASLIHSVCKVEHLAKIDAAAAAIGKVQPILLEVNVSGEESKSGFAPSEAGEVLLAACALPNLVVKGLMTMAPRADEDAIHTSFSGLAKLKDQLNELLASQGQGLRLTELSMGMSEDWPEAIPFGATIVRVGRAIFDASFE
jgi:pyridoxal phosphate enzyme (YggS family)